MQIQNIAIYSTAYKKKKLEKIHPAVGEIYRDFFGVFFPQAVFDIFDVTKDIFPENIYEYDLSIITGSAASAYEALPWINVLSDCIRRLHQEKKLIVGICFGHQIIAQALGGEVCLSDTGWSIGIKEVTFKTPEPWMHPYLEKLNISHIHQDQVKILPPRARVLSVDELCPYGAFAIDDHILSIQGHPEFGKEYLRDLLEIVKEKFPQDTFEEALTTLDRENNGDIFGQWIQGFTARKRAF